jgi:hypothetical protein
MHDVHDQVLAWIDDPGPVSFDALALAVFAHQFERIEPYRRFCLQRGASPGSVDCWQQIPPVPVQAFKHVDLCCSTPQHTFLSSGTTAGTARRSRHTMPDLRLYQRAALSGLRRFVFPDTENMPILSLVPPVSLLPDSSLAQMVAWAFAAFGAAGSLYAVDPEEIAYPAAVGFLRAAERSGQPCCIMTTTGALIRLIEHARVHDLTFRLPHGSRIMDTGGDKGAPRRLSRNGLLHACWSTLAVPGYFCVNEYGMTELSSQYYDSVIADRVSGTFRHRTKIGPPWLRTLVVDAATLAPLPRGETGLLCHFDLANAGSAMAVSTEDVGRMDGDGLELLGRVTDAELRGCSLTLAEWEASAREA